MKEQLKKLFPFISAAASLGGPLGTMAANALGKAIGADKVEPTQDGIIAALEKASPEALLKAQAAEQQFKLDMQKLGFEHAEELEKIAAEDRNSARNREIQVRDWMPKVLGIGALAIFGACMFVLIKVELPQRAEQVVVYMLGILSGMVKDVYGYFFGSSVGSAKKDDAITEIAKG